MKITHRGTPATERIWVGVCRSCKSEAEATESEMTNITHDQREGGSFSLPPLPPPFEVWGEDEPGLIEGYDAETVERLRLEAIEAYKAGLIAKWENYQANEAEGDAFTVGYFTRVEEEDAALAQQQGEAVPFAWHVCSVNKDGSLSLEFAAAWQEAAHEHINDAIADHGIEDAAAWVVRPAYHHPAPAQQPLNAWIKTADQMPPSGKTVLAFYLNANGLPRRVRAQWVAAKSSESGSESDIGEYDEATDTYYDPEGWYEQIDNWDDLSAVAICGVTVTHWMLLPEPPAHGIGGEKP
jgi:hypothetical protein